MIESPRHLAGAHCVKREDYTAVLELDLLFRNVLQ